MPERTQVIIVGGGPVGHGLAVTLGQRGINCVLIERHLEPVKIPKGQNLTPRTLEHFYFWQCVEELRAARVMPPDYSAGGVTCYGTLMGEHWHARGLDRVRSVQEFYFQANERLPQYCTEAVLRARAAALPSVTTLYGKIARAVEADDNGVKVTVADAPNDGRAFYSWSADAQDSEAAEGTDTVLEADYVVGCDGGHSLVRRTLGIDRDGRDFDERMVLAVFRSKELHEALKRFPECSTFRVLKPELKGYWQFFGRIDVGEGFFFHAPVAKDTNRETFNFLGLMQEVAGFRFAAELDHVGFWDLRIMVASAYGSGRMFIAGDAAHQHPPYGGFGLNTGLEDAVNLGWKLAARLEGWGSDALLASYGEERRPIIVQTGEDMIAGGIERDREWLERCGPEHNRAEFERVWDALGNDLRTAIMPSYEPHYEGSPVVCGPPRGETGIHGDHSLVARAGHHLSPRVLSSGRNVYEELAQGFTLIALGIIDDDVTRFETAAADLAVPLSVVRDSYDSGREAYDARLILVRPDQYVAWAGDAAPANPGAVLRRVVGR